ncbi:unnamed protein product [Mesocestoides corti]|uniref:RING-type domain-containing protein n=1 Tax=Mesocestoides corti TaxID=53468 RepID=A0A0R3UH52_MESCO|nr:unnamed protein product [Mesocestoides corti]
MDKVTQIPIEELNSMLTCYICKGYIIDATTVVECLHSFCKTCIIKFLEHRNTCPVCDTLLHKTRPQYAIRSDYVLQAIVYKLLPKVFEREMSSRREFYASLPSDDVRPLSPEKRGDITLSAYVDKEEERVSLELSFWRDSHPSPPGIQPTTYLLCPPALTVGHLEKLIRLKFDLKPSQHAVDFFFVAEDGDRFTSDYTISDLICLNSCASSWIRAKRGGVRNRPMKLFFSVSPVSQSPRDTVGLSQVENGATASVANNRAVLTSS